nr:MAG TPA: hypothetical protein [Caudoviricetes sp.]
MQTEPPEAMNGSCARQLRRESQRDQDRSW